MRLMMFHNDVFVILAAALIGAGMVEAIFSGGRYSRDEGLGPTPFRVTFAFIISAVAFWFIGWIWHLILLAVFFLRIVMLHGRSEVYDEAPSVPEINYGSFTGIAEKRAANVPIPADDRLKELMADGRVEEARKHAREMMEVAKSVGDVARAEKYRKWLGG